MHKSAFTHEPQQDARSDRAVRWVLRASLAIGVVPMAAAVALVGPSLLGLDRPGDAALQSELSAGRPAAADGLRGILRRGASGIVRAVKGQPDAQDAELGRLEVRAFDPAAGPASLTGAPSDEACAAGGADCSRPSEADIRLTLLELPRSARLAPPRAAIDAGEPAAATGGTGWQAPAEGVFLREVGDALFVIEGAVAAADPAALGRFNVIGLDLGQGGYRSDDLELKHSSLSGSAEHRFSQGRWTLRPGIDLGASHLDLERVRVDPTGAGLALPQADDWVFSARPSVALEGELDPVPGVTLLPSLSAGATWLSQTEFQDAAMMLDAPTGVAGLAALTPLEETFANVEAGIGLTAAQRIQLSVRYGRLFGETLEADTGRVQLNMQF